MDINPQFIERAKTRFPEHGRQFRAGNALDDKTFARIKRSKSDLVVASGVFCYTGEKNFFRKLVYRLYSASKMGLIFNVICADTPKKRIKNTPGIVRWKLADVLQIIRYCECRSYEIIRTYLANDMTIVMRKKWSD